MGEYFYCKFGWHLARQYFSEEQILRNTVIKQRILTPCDHNHYLTTFYHITQRFSIGENFIINFVASGRAQLISIIIFLGPIFLR